MMKTNKIITSALTTIALATSVHSESTDVNSNSPRAKQADGPVRTFLMQKFDKDGDGQLNETERAELKKQMMQRKEERKAKMLERFDSDKDGKLSAEERKTAFPVIAKENKEIHQAIRSEFDKNGDGKISPDEAKGIREWVQENHPDAIMMRPRAMRAYQCGKLDKRGPKGSPLGPKPLRQSEVE
ncbi:MAG: EF-hand domain-containing protein [Akkermansiaceae bacterium]